jgi:hypothetical protein
VHHGWVLCVVCQSSHADAIVAVQAKHGIVFYEVVACRLMGSQLSSYILGRNIRCGVEEGKEGRQWTRTGRCRVHANPALKSAWAGRAFSTPHRYDELDSFQCITAAIGFLHDTSSFTRYISLILLLHMDHGREGQNADFDSHVWYNSKCMPAQANVRYTDDSATLTGTYICLVALIYL